MSKVLRNSCTDPYLFMFLNTLYCFTVFPQFILVMGAQNSPNLCRRCGRNFLAGAVSQSGVRDPRLLRSRRGPAQQTAAAGVISYHHCSGPDYPACRPTPARPAPPRPAPQAG